MPKLNIPMSGDEYILTEDWKPRLYQFDANKEIIRMTNPEWSLPYSSRLYSRRWIASRFDRSLPSIEANIPKETKLIMSTVCRHVRVRRGQEPKSFVLVKFILPKDQINGNKRCSITVLIEDARNIVYKESE